MINPFLTGLTLLLWMLTIAWGLMYFPFAFGSTIYLIAVTLFFTPTIRRGSLPPLDDVYVRAICNCLKSKQLSRNDNDIIPAIACEATHILYDLDLLWQYDTLLCDNLDKNQSSEKVVKYLTSDPLSRTEIRPSTAISPNSNLLDDEKANKLHVKDRELITTRIKRVRTIPLAISPISYYQPIFNLESMIQTFIHFPLSAMKAVLTGVDMTMYFPSPRGAHFFFDSGIIGIRQGGGGLKNSEANIHHNSNRDLLVDVQTVVMIDRKRLAKLYTDELDEDKEESRQAEEIKKLPTEEEQMQAIDVIELQKGREKTRRLKKYKEIPQELVTVARIVNTYTYHNSINTTTYQLSSQDHFPYDNNKFDQTFFQEMRLSTPQQRQATFAKQPQLTVNPTGVDGVNFAYMIGNAHPRMISGLVSTLFGYNSTNNNQLDCTYALLLALSTFHAENDDNLQSGLDQSQFAGLLREENTVEKIELKDDTVSKSTPTSSQMIYPYRVLLQTVETISAPSTIHCYLQPSHNNSSLSQIQHRGHSYAEHQLKRQQKDDYVTATTPLSTEAFPQFNTKQLIELTVRDPDAGKNNEVVWAHGVILTNPKLDVQ